MPKNNNADGGGEQIQQIVDKEQAQGFRGTVPDPTPNFNYTVAGNDAPTPETDNGMKLAAMASARQLEGLEHLDLDNDGDIEEAPTAQLESMRDAIETELERRKSQ